MGNDVIGPVFAQKYNRLRKLFDEDKLDECITGCQDLLEDDCPRYIRSKILVLLGSSAADWNDTEDCRTEAEMYWNLARRFHTEGEDPVSDSKGTTPLATHSRRIV